VKLHSAILSRRGTLGPTVVFLPIAPRRPPPPPTLSTLLPHFAKLRLLILKDQQ
jgi:hypothetical protein